MTERQAIEGMRYRIDTATEIAGKGEDGKAFEDMEMAIKALEKQIPKKPIKVDSGVHDYPFDYECPYCNKNVDELDHHCECGQTLDWGKAKLDNFIEECKQPSNCKEYERPKEIDKVINGLIDFDSYSFYQDNINKLITYVEELESLIKAIAYVVVKPEYR